MTPAGDRHGDDGKAAWLRRTLSPDRVCFLDVTSKAEALRILIAALARSSSVGGADELARAVFRRETA